MEEIQKSVKLINFNDSIFDADADADKRGREREIDNGKEPKENIESESGMLSSVSLIKYLLKRTITRTSTSTSTSKLVDSDDELSNNSNNNNNNNNNMYFGFG